MLDENSYALRCDLYDRSTRMVRDVSIVGTAGASKESIKSKISDRLSFCPPPRSKYLE
jgi:hypothetical protein